MRLSRLFPLAILAALAGPAISSSSTQAGPPPETDRVPNKDRAQMFPRWTRMLVGFPSSGNPLGIVAKEMAVQDDGTVHLLLCSPNAVFYSNNRPEARTRNGFSAPFLIKAGTTTLPALLGDIAVGRDGRLTAIYGVVKTDSTGVFPFTDLHVRQYDPVAMTWGPDTQLTSGSVTSSSASRTTTTYGSPSVTYGVDGKPHVVYFEKITVEQFSPQMVQLTQSIKYSVDLVFPETIKTGTTQPASPGNVDPTGLPVEIQWSSRLCAPPVAVSPLGVPHVMWLQHDSVLQRSIHYGSKNGTWSDENISIAPDSCDFDVAVDELGEAHLAYTSSLGLPSYRRKPADMDLLPAELISATVASINIKVAIDARRRPVVITANVGRVSYATKVENPDLAQPNQWVIQEGLDLPVGDDRVFIADIHVSPGSEFVHAIHETGWYTRQLEPNSGIQDSFTMVPFGPGTSANVATGNLRFELPLFTARTGFGFGTAFSLVYNSLDGERGSISPGWSTSFDMYVTDDGRFADSDLDLGAVNLHLGEGRIITFEHRFFPFRTAPDEFGNFSRMDRAILTPGVYEYTLTMKSGIKYVFENSGRLRRIEDLNMNKLELEYPDGPLRIIKDSHNRQTMLDYDASKRLMKVTDPGMNTYTLTYGTPTGTNPPVGKLEKITFDGAPSGQTVAWRFEYYTATNFDRAAMPPLEEHKGLLSKLFTPRGNAENYFYQFGYKPDGRVISVTEPEEMSVTNDTATSAPLTDSNDMARRDIFYIDPVEPFDAPHVDEGTTGTRVSPAAILKDRRGFETRIEFQYMRCLADRIHDALPGTQGGPGRLRRFFDTQEIFESSMGPPITAPRFRNLKRFVDKEGNETKYEYTYEDEPTQEEPKYVMDNVRRILQPPANSQDQPGPDGSAASVEVVEYKYKENAFSRVEKVIDTFEKETEYVYETGTLNLEEIKYPSVAGQGIAIESFSYGMNGRLENHTSPENQGSGAKTVYQYDSTTGLVSSILRPGHGSAETFSYHPTFTVGLVKQHAKPMGGITQFEYDGLYRVIMQIPPAGDVGSMIETKYDLDSNLTEVDGPDGENTKHEFDKLGRVKKTTRRASGALDLVTDLKYDREGNTREVKDPRNKRSVTTYDRLGRVTEERQPGPPLIVTIYSYNLNGAVKTRKVAGQTSTSTYSGRGLLLKSTNSGFSGESDETEYHEDGTVKESTRKSGGLIVTKSVNGYDARRRLISTTQVADLVGGGGFSTQYVLDKNSNRVRVIDADLRSTFFEFDSSDRQTITRDHDLAFLSETVYDDNDRVDLRTVAHPDDGSPVVAVDYTYNDRDEVKTERDFFNNLTTHFYDGRGNRLRSIGPTSNGATCETRMVFDFAGRLTNEIHAFGTVDQAEWVYEYDENGNRTKIRDPRFFEYVFTYDDGNRMTSLTYPSVAGQSFVESWTYDDRGNMETHTDPEGKVATMTYDLRDRLLTEVHVKNGVTIADVSRDYDDRGNLVFVHDEVSQLLVSFVDPGGLPAYDALNRLTEVNWHLEVPSVTFQNGQLSHGGQAFGRVQYRKPTGEAGYDGAGNLTHMEFASTPDPEWHRFEYTYDANGRLHEIRRTPQVGASPLVAKHLYSVSGLKREVQLQGGSVQKWTYDGKSRLKEIELKRPDQSVAAHLRYTYDGRDRRTHLELLHLSRVVQYGYDCRDRLTSETWTSTVESPPPPPCGNNPQNPTPGNLSAFTLPVCATPSNGAAILYSASWEYDGAGNRLKQTEGSVVTDYVYDAQNRLTEEKRNGLTVVSYLHDKNGNQIQRSEGGVVETFVYDYMNRIEHYVRGSVSFMYRYMPTGERVAKIDTSAGGLQEWFMYDGQDVAADFSRSGAMGPLSILRTYVNGRAIDSKIGRIEAGGTLYFYAGDALGSVHEMIETSGTVVRQSLYTAWGRDLPGFSGFSSIPDRYAFSQRERDPESALMHYRARSYDPRTGRFQQKDPLPDERVRTAYVYANNAPTQSLDPLGTFTIGSAVTPEGHELLTRGGLAGLFKHKAIEEIVEGNREADWPPGVSLFSLAAYQSRADMQADHFVRGRDDEFAVGNRTARNESTTPDITLSRSVRFSSYGQGRTANRSRSRVPGNMART